MNTKAEKVVHRWYNEWVSRRWLLWLAFVVSAMCFSTACHKTFPANPLLFRAASDGRNDLIESSLKEGADVNAREQEGETPLMYAAANGHTDTVLFLIDKGADVNAVSNNNETALARAASVGHTATVQTLLEKGAYVN